MSLEDWLDGGRETVDPEVRAFVGSLVNAVGGISIQDDGRYVLGDDATGCLRDIRRWLRFYDEKLERLDVQRVLAESNFLKGDIIEILGSWSDEDAVTGFKAKIALLCLEILVPLTWTLEVEDEKMTIHHHKHLPYLRLAQVEYKRAILLHESGKILRQMIRIALPSMAETKKDRTPRDNGIIRLVLYGIRNIVMISQPEDLPANGDESEISRAMTIEAFHQQDIFQFLLTIASSMGEEFDIQDVVLLEALFHLLKGIDPTTLFMNDDEVTQTKTDELRHLLNKEKAMLSGYKKHAPTRHSRFGTMVWLKKDNETISTISGQAAISGPNRGLKYLDKAKKWNKPKQGSRKQEVQGSSNFDRAVHLSGASRKHLRHFVEEFLDSSFNPLFSHLRRSIERELERVLSMHRMQYFYLVSWFLKAECARREAQKASKAQKGKQKSGEGVSTNSESFSIIAGVMNQETFVLLNRFLQTAYDDKSWQGTNAGMKCFTQILLTVQQMEQSSDEYDQEIAENIQNRIFYEESTHDRVLSLLRNYKDQGRGYLDAVTELSHVFIRMLENYSKQNENMQIRSKRRSKKLAQQAKPDEAPAENEENAAEEVQTAKRTTSERKFSFQKFAGRFASQAAVDTFVALIKTYKDLNTEQLKRAHRYFYRVAFKLDLCTILFRLDVIQLFYNMLKGPAPIGKESPQYKDWEELSKQIFKKLTKRIKEHPELMVEMLFSKIPSTVYYLENGHDMEIIKSAPRVPVEWEVKGDIASGDQVSLVTEVLVGETKFDALSWIKEELQRAQTERQAWEDEKTALQAISNPPAESEESTETPTNPAEPTAAGDDNKPPVILLKQPPVTVQNDVFKSPKIRLLLSLLKIERLDLEDTPGATYCIPSNLSATDLATALSKIQSGERGDTLLGYANAKPAVQYLRRKPHTVEVDDEDGHVVIQSDSEGEESLDEALFAMGPGPTERKADHDGVNKPKKRRLKRSKREVTDEEKKKRAKDKKEKERDKRRKIKSDAFIHESDDESDEEKDKLFFEKEEKMRIKMGSSLMKAVEAAQKEDARKRKGSDDEAEENSESGSQSRKKRRVLNDDSDASDEDDEVIVEREVVDISSDHSSTEDEESEMSENEDTPSTSQPQPPVLDADANKENEQSKDISMKEAEDSDSDIPVKRPVVRRNVRGGFVIVDSDSDD